MNRHHRRGSIQPATAIAILSTLLLIVSALFYYISYTEQQREVERIEQRARRAEQTASELADRIDRLAALVGHGDAADFESLQEAIERDLAPDHFGRSSDAVPAKSYVDALARLEERLARQETLLGALEADNRRLRQQFATREQSTQAAVEVAEQARQRAEEDLAQYQSQFDSILSDKDAVIGRFQQRAHELATQAEQLAEENQEQKRELLGQIQRLQAWIRLLKSKDQPPRASPDDRRPDGEVVRVAASGERAYINLGSRHGVTRGLTFSVYDRNLERDRPKARLELTRIIDRQLSEARLFEAKITDPVLAGDKLVNPLWKQGQKQRVALAGFFDLDRDGREDRRLVRALLARAGATVDAEALPDGQLRGALTVDTNYLIVAPEPPGGSADALGAMSQLIRAAEDYSVPQISLERFLEQSGLDWAS